MVLSEILLSIFWLGLFIGSYLILRFLNKGSAPYFWMGIWFGFITIIVIIVISLAVISGKASDPLGVILAYLGMSLFIIFTVGLFREGYLILKNGGRKTIEFPSQVDAGE